MGLQNKETNGHRRIGLVQFRVIAGKELLQRNEIAKTFSHLLAVDRDHVVVHPVAHHLFSFGRDGLRDLAFVMWEDEVHSPAVDVEMIAQVLASHSRTFAMPARKAVAPRRWPAHNMLRAGFFPKGEVYLIALFVYTVQCSARVNGIFEVAPREYAVAILGVVFFYIEVNRPVALICVAVIKDFLHERFLFDNVT